VQNLARIDSTVTKMRMREISRFHVDFFVCMSNLSAGQCYGFEGRDTIF